MLVIAIIPLHLAYVAGNVSKMHILLRVRKNADMPISLESASLILRGRVLVSGMLHQSVLCTKDQGSEDSVTGGLLCPLQAPVTLDERESTFFALCV